jgi:uncharacterized protein YneR
MKVSNKFNKRNFQKFEKFVREYCELHRKKIIIKPTKHLRSNGVKYGGCCDGNSMQVASKNPLFENIFVHEFSHMTQAVEEIDLWYDYGDIWEPLAENRISIASWDEFMKVIALERDCERRALKFIRQFNLCSEEDYALKANTYLYYYQYVFLTKNWNQKKSIYGCPEVNALMPTKLLPMSTFKKIDMKIMEAFFKYLKK